MCNKCENHQKCAPPLKALTDIIYTENNIIDDSMIEYITDVIVSGMSCFLLNGKAYIVVIIRTAASINKTIDAMGIAGSIASAADASSEYIAVDAIAIMHNIDVTQHETQQLCLWKNAIKIGRVDKTSTAIINNICNSISCNSLLLSIRYI